MTNLTERFLRYVKIDTESDANVDSTPSTQKQFDLGNLLVSELKELGLQDVSIDEKCYIQASLPSNTDKEVPTIGLIAHVDTSPDTTGKNVNPLITKNYDGGDIVLNKDLNVVLSPKDFPEMKNYLGQDIISTDGTTLLGADDKAGIAEIMTAMEFLQNNPEIKHGTIKVGFTPDEEIGRGANFFDVEKFGADYAYTIDGGEIGELEYENFNAAGAVVTIKGRNIHPGYAKDKMINSMIIGMEFNALLPVNARPEHTTGYDGFFHLMKMQGIVDETKLQYIIRDHDADKFDNLKKIIKDAEIFINEKHGEGIANVEITEQYRNMREKIEPVMHIVDNAEKAMIEAGVTPIKKAIRGGTDGARLSYMGLPTPNIFGGGHNFHGKFEYIPIQSMEKAVEVIVNIVKV